MKKISFFLALILSISTTMICLAAEADTRNIPEEASEKIQVSEIKDTPAQETGTNTAIGKWYRVGKTEGNFIRIPDYTFYIYPDGTVTNDDSSICLPAELADDGSFTVDTSSSEAYADFIITGEIIPVSKEGMDRFEVKKDALGYVDYSADQLILTLSYPDPSNPLASTLTETTVCFMRYENQCSLIKNYMFGKMWKIGENTLKIDPEGNLDLNNGSSVGKASMYFITPNEDTPSVGLSAKVSFRWENGGTINYLPERIAADQIELRNIDKPEEILVLEYKGNVKAAQPVRPAVSADNPFIGTWETLTITKNGEEIPANDLLQADSLTAQATMDGLITLKFDNDFSAVLEPSYGDNVLSVRYDQPGYNMTWSAVWNEDDTVTATYGDFTISLIRVQQEG